MSRHIPNSNIYREEEVYVTGVVRDRVRARLQTFRARFASAGVVGPTPATVDFFSRVGNGGNQSNRTRENCRETTGA